MTLSLRIPTGLIDLADMGLMDFDEGRSFRIGTLDILRDREGKVQRPRTQYKGPGLKTYNLRGEIWPIGASSLSHWTNLMAYLDTSDDPVVRLINVIGTRQTTLGQYYVLNPRMSYSDVLNGVPLTRTWRFSLQEYAEGQPVSEGGSSGDQGEEFDGEEQLPPVRV